MAKLKTAKAAKKRFKLSSKGKVRRRAVHQSHFNAKDDGNTRRKKRGGRLTATADTNNMKRIMPYTSH